MASIAVRPLADDLSFGARVTGLDWEAIRDEAVRQQVRDVFDDRGMIIFEGMEPSDEMQVELSSVFGAPQAHAIKGMRSVENEGMVGVVNLGGRLDGKAADVTIWEIDGEEIAGRIDWHFDSCYMEKLNRGGILRLTVITPEKGLTGFADGVQIYNALSPEWRDTAEGLNVVYDQYLMQHEQRFGLPEGGRLTRLQTSLQKIFEEAKGKPRAVHPAVWQRPGGEKVLHVAPWQAAGVEGREDAEGDALFDGLWREVRQKMTPYWHKWQPTDMAIWDNWRFLHAVSGYDPQYPRNARRTTIEGDYGLGRLASAREARGKVGA